MWIVSIYNFDDEKDHVPEIFSVEGQKIFSNWIQEEQRKEQTNRKPGFGIKPENG